MQSLRQENYLSSPWMQLSPHRCHCLASQALVLAALPHRQAASSPSRSPPSALSPHDPLPPHLLLQQKIQIKTPSLEMERGGLRCREAEPLVQPEQLSSKSQPNSSSRVCAPPLSQPQESPRLYRETGQPYKFGTRPACLAPWL